MGSRRHGGARGGRHRARELAAIRALVPGLAFLVPGVGAQGGALAPVLAEGPATSRPAGGRSGGGLLVNVSRGIARAASDAPSGGRRDDPMERLERAAAAWAAQPRCATLTPSKPPEWHRSRHEVDTGHAVQHRTR